MRGWEIFVPDTAHQIRIIAKFVGNDDLLRAVDRNAMVDKFLVKVFERAGTDKELDALKAGLETAAGISSLTGALTGGAGLAVGATLELTTLAMEGVEMRVEDHKAIFREKERLKVDDKLETVRKDTKHPNPVSEPPRGPGALE